jgi:hypothetical protein
MNYDAILEEVLEFLQRESGLEGPGWVFWRP